MSNWTELAARAKEFAARKSGKSPDPAGETVVTDLEQGREQLERRRELQRGYAALHASRQEVPRDKIADMVDWFACLLESGHTLEEALDGVRFYALGAYGSME